ncbi:unnamed protein product [Acanthosepion pharaonis]|uniref:Uncharacterized protein n=1 Tax=Acanthosepion pharaonis TaxID=158019 RepID=A0A812CMF7_ACAPH|nr:unnamed protein product [Sepia pharaonis]
MKEGRQRKAGGTSLNSPTQTKSSVLTPLCTHVTAVLVKKTNSIEKVKSFLFILLADFSLSLPLYYVRSDARPHSQTNTQPRPVFPCTKRCGKRLFIISLSFDILFSFTLFCFSLFFLCFSFPPLCSSLSLLLLLSLSFSFSLSPSPSLSLLLLLSLSFSFSLLLLLSLSFSFSLLPSFSLLLLLSLSFSLSLLTLQPPLALKPFSLFFCSPHLLLPPLFSFPFLFILSFSLLHKPSLFFCIYAFLLFCSSFEFYLCRSFFFISIPPPSLKIFTP